MLRHTLWTLVQPSNLQWLRRARSDVTIRMIIWNFVWSQWEDRCSFAPHRCCHQWKCDFQNSIWQLASCVEINNTDLFFHTNCKFKSFLARPLSQLLCRLICRFRATRLWFSFYLLFHIFLLLLFSLINTILVFTYVQIDVRPASSGHAPQDVFSPRLWRLELNLS
jgi:hypothetical protein